MPNLNASKGGKARAEKLTKEQRQEISRKAAEARWGVKTARAVYGSPDRPLCIGDIEIPCYVLEDGRRVLSQSGMQTGVGFSRSGGTSGAQRLAKFVSSLERKGIDSKGLAVRIAEPISFVPPRGGPRAHGYEATILADLCDVILAARKAGVLMKQQEHIAGQAEILVRGFARVGIIALVDEATGYQDERERNALAKILEAFVAKELQPWVKTFPLDYYKHIYRLKGIEYDPSNPKKPRSMGHLTNNLIYRRLAPGVLEEIKRQSPRDSTGRHKNKLFQRLTPDLGHPKLREHIASVVGIMAGYDDEDWEAFERHLDRAHPRYDRTIEMPFRHESKKKH
ncbi:MAG: P63C domain-containing protein [Myxococcota bacterium]